MLNRYLQLESEREVLCSYPVAFPELVKEPREELEQIPYSASGHAASGERG